MASKGFEGMRPRPNLTSLVITRQRLKVACIMDGFTFNSFAPECDLYQLTPGNWVQQLSKFKPDLLFVESAWRGADNLWSGRVAQPGHALRGIVEWCRAHSVPTVFWNKEDPIHFTTFLNTARWFDHVFTTDLDCVPRYKERLRHDRVHLLPFACQPRAFNPLGADERLDAFCFAGAYYTRYPDRASDLERFIGELTKSRPFLIYDRNDGGNAPDDNFPPEFEPFILGGLPVDQVDRIYKGYLYAINLNSVKQSQTMCPRRVFELLACNTVVISNYGRSVRLMLGDLVFASDDPAWTTHRLQEFLGEGNDLRRLRLAGLRKVLQEHTCGDRLRHVWTTVSGDLPESSLPSILIVSYCNNESDARSIAESVERQTYEPHSLLVVTDSPDSVSGAFARFKEQVAVKLPGESHSLAGESPPDLIAAMVPQDYYGPNYLLDMALSTHFTDAPVIGKQAFYRAEGNEVQLRSGSLRYSRVQHLAARRAVARRELFAKVSLTRWATRLDSFSYGVEGVSIDEFNYCEEAARHRQADIRGVVDDLRGLDKGLDVGVLLGAAEEAIPAVTPIDDVPVITGAELGSMLEPADHTGVSLEAVDDRLLVTSRLPNGDHIDVYSQQNLEPAELRFRNEGRFFLDADPGLDLRVALRFFNDRQAVLGSTVLRPNENHSVTAPAGTTSVRIGLRIRGNGAAKVDRFVLGHRRLESPVIRSGGNHLVLTNHYPEYSNLYRNAFVHRRVVAYKRKGAMVDVFRLRPRATLSYHEFEGVDCITGSQETLSTLLRWQRYESIMVHFLNKPMWNVLRQHANGTRMVVWIHGAEIQPWHRRSFNFDDDLGVLKAKEEGEARLAFWRGVIEEAPTNMKLVFVSRYLAHQAIEDLGVTVPEDMFEIVHNPIDTELFAYEPKSLEQRKRILSIRPFASRKYANDLTVKAMLALQEKDWFEQLEFRIVGDGPLFEEVVAPVRSFDNVFIERRFLNQREIAKLHREYGVFLCPSRWDSQGVSRDEAMASGLVPVTTNVAAIPEFVDETCGMVVPPEDPQALADAIAQLVENPGLFTNLSSAAAQRVRKQSAIDRIISAELALAGAGG